MQYYFMPNRMLKSVYDIDLHALRGLGYEYILFDLDNTLVPWNDHRADAKLSQWMKLVGRLGFACIIVSNNNAARIKPVADALGVAYLEHAGKPSKLAVTRAMKKLGATAKKTVFVGDQVVTDVWAGKKAGVYTILVSPIAQREYFGTKINRFFEGMILGMMGVKRP